ncbi:MAG: class I SAM-dependent methyltransferase [Gammaproteobacteria bacterium]|nr:class I SAM-dependent methyltransferase [Gammaproteobacteria bacterium]MBU1556856.1 class I SAM-dependent methyltransferase [Gammaproteobacteria bacterium]MBU2071070.1 class I SAM-dependent methyltransferase [Gammaproteobacteria bacterium]MBU2184338.1 class I SAM-dependent methyltransferase [Gammaproteobacteria bacterium]MBU2206405.1 class I SAM-dependent methyltransferase [Gammaproteobacteria bacterium]
MSSATIDYYNRHAAEYVQSTINVDMTALYAEFLPLIATGSHILDAGCGSGRDAAYFKQLGFTVSAFDASGELAKIASQRLQQTVTVQQFEQLDEYEQYDGIWCCASLLHVATDSLPSVFFRLQQALKPGGVLYMSFKYGDGEHDINGRRFTDMNDAELKKILKNVATLSVIKTWLTQDQRANRNHEVWFNALVTKPAS